MCVRGRNKRETFSSWMAAINFPASSRYLNFRSKGVVFLTHSEAAWQNQKKAKSHRWRTMSLDHIWVFCGRRASSSVYLSRQSSSSMARYNIGFSSQGGFECNARLIYDLLVNSWNFAWHECTTQEKYLILRTHFDASSLKSAFDISGVLMFGGSPVFACGRGKREGK